MVRTAYRKDISNIIRRKVYLVTDATGGVTTYRYRPDRIVTSVEDPLGNTTRYEYTEHSELYRVIDPEGV